MVKISINLEKIKKILERSIKNWKLNLRNLTVLTEAASGNYIYTPLIAAMSGAKVYILAKDSSYGLAKNIEEGILFLAKPLKLLKKLKIFKNYLPPTIINQADIITNSGFLRPINKRFISYLKKTAVIPLMYETWEYREEDLDLRACWEKGILVLGTNEHHPKLNILEYLGPLVLKKILEAGLEIYKLKAVVIADKIFGPPIIKTLENNGVEVKKSFSRAGNADILIIAYHKKLRVIIGKSGLITAQKLKQLSPTISVIQICGNGFIDRRALKKEEIFYMPFKAPRPSFLSWTLADLAPRPVIELHVAGLKVGEILARAQLRGLSRENAEMMALKNSPAQDFSKDQKRQYGY